MSKQCPVCKGRGQPKDTRTTFHFEQVKGKKERKYVTDQLGYGCLKCGGTGRV